MRLLGHHSGRGATAPHTPPSKDQINQRTKDSRTARAGANCTNDAYIVLPFVCCNYGAAVEERVPRAEGIGDVGRRRPIGRRRCGTADSSKSRVYARSHATGRRLSRSRLRADQDRLQLRNLRQTPVAAVGKATRRGIRVEQAVQPNQEVRVSRAVCGSARTRPRVEVGHIMDIGCRRRLSLPLQARNVVRHRHPVRARLEARGRCRVVCRNRSRVGGDV